MGSRSLVMPEIDSGEMFVREFNKYKPVRAAFWLKESDDDRYYLYITSDQIDDVDVRAAYSEAGRVASQMETPFFDVMRIKIVSAHRPLARAFAELIDKYPSSMARRLGGQRFGDLFADDVYLYPPPLTAAAL